MIGRASLLIVAFAVGVAAASFVPGLTESVRKAVGLAAARKRKSPPPKRPMTNKRSN
jgi:hypothetical protein